MKPTRQKKNSKPPLWVIDRSSEQKILDAALSEKKIPQKKNDTLDLIREFINTRVRQRAFPSKGIEIPEWVLQRIGDSFWAYCQPGEKRTIDQLLGLDFGRYNNRHSVLKKDRLLQRDYFLISEMIEREQAGMSARKAAEFICRPGEPSDPGSFLDCLRKRDEQTGKPIDSIMQTICTSYSVPTITARTLENMYAKRLDLRDIVLSWRRAFEATSKK